MPLAIGSVRLATMDIQLALLLTMLPTVLMLMDSSSAICLA
jgi:hypothetical protein